MKKIFMLTSVIIAFLLLPTSSYGQQDECIDMHTPPGAICGNWVSYSKTIYLTPYGTQYGTCAIDIQYQTRVCQVISGQCTTRVEQFRLNYFGWDGSDPDCDNFTQYILPGYPDEFSGTDPMNIGQFLGDMFDHLMDLHFSEYIAGLTPAQRLTFRCDGVAPDCSIPACSGYEASYISPQCRDLCIDFNNQTHITVNFGICSADPPACCILTAKYCLCYNSFNQLVQIVSNRTIYSDTGDCGGNGSLYGTCFYGPGNEVYYQPCTAICPIIDSGD